jgi:hypothetical protein
MEIELELIIFARSKISLIRMHNHDANPPNATFTPPVRKSQQPISSHRTRGLNTPPLHHRPAKHHSHPVGTAHCQGDTSVYRFSFRILTKRYTASGIASRYRFRPIPIPISPWQMFTMEISSETICYGAVSRIKQKKISRNSIFLIKLISQCRSRKWIYDRIPVTV